MNRKFLFAALLFTALSVGFTACENLKDEIENPELPAVVATGGATDVEYSSVTLWGRINTDTLWVFSPLPKWGVESATSIDDIRTHKGTKTLCTTDLMGENTDEYSVSVSSESYGGKMLYYNAYLKINDIEYVYGEVDSVRLLSRITVNSNNTSWGTVTGSGDYAFGTGVTLTATPASEGYEFVKWSDGDTDNPRTLIVTGNLELTAIFDYAAVDLGLPSGIRWATMNVGATSPEKYGNYYAWGETEPKTMYNWSTYKWCNGRYDDLTRYCTDSKCGIVDNITELKLADDAARVNWGGAWRMPTNAEWTELSKNCTWTWTTDYNGTGVKGDIVTSVVNGNSIFLPAAGYRVDYNLFDVGNNGIYWSSSLNTNDSDYAKYKAFGSNVLDYNRPFGLSVRPVLGE